MAAVLIVALGFRSLVAEPFTVEQTSMAPTLIPGDQVLVTKVAYGYNRYSFPFHWPPIDGRLLPRPVERGDIVVLRLTRGAGANFIKRVIALPGETVRLKDGQVFIDGIAVPRTPLSPLSAGPAARAICGDTADGPRSDERCRLRRYRERLPNGVAYVVLDVQKNGPEDTSRTFQVPPGHVFVLGDNRDRSKDSRHPLSVGTGYVPMDRLIGRADRIVFSRAADGPPWRPRQWLAAFRPDRWWKEL